MATNHECPVLEASMAAFDLSQPAAAEDSHQSLDVVDLLPGPIWHIIFRHLLLPPTDSAQEQKQDDSDEELSSRGAADSRLCELIGLHQRADPLEGAGSCSWLSTSQLSEREKHKEYARRFGPSWPLLRCAMASKRLLHHVMSLSVSHHHVLPPFPFQPSASLPPCHLLVCGSCTAPRLMHFCHACTIQAPILKLEFLSARVITVRFEEQELDVCFSLTPSLKAFLVSALELNVECNSDNPLSLDSLTLIARRHLVVSSLPLASAKNVYLNGPTSLVEPSAPLDELYNVPSISQRSLTASQLSLTQLLSSIAPTVETLVVRHGSPLEEVCAEWSCLRCLAIGANGTGIGFKFMITVEDDGSLDYWMGIFSPEGGSSSSSSGHEGIRPPVINAPKLESIFFATRQWQPETLASLRSDFPSLTFYCIVDRSFWWEGKGKNRGMRRMGAIVLTKGSAADSTCLARAANDAAVGDAAFG
ncbi:unnamed protein product [Closterium sp. NIES-64]|nr:unnamed protein product [Closterium sp. NIES-64]